MLPGATSGCFVLSVTDTYNTSLAAKKHPNLGQYLARLHELSKGGLSLGVAKVLRNQRMALFLIPVDSVLLGCFRLFNQGIKLKSVIVTVI